MQGCSHSLPLSVAQVQQEIVGDPKIGVFTMGTVSMKKYAVTIQGMVHVK